MGVKDFNQTFGFLSAARGLAVLLGNVSSFGSGALPDKMKLAWIFENKKCILYLDQVR